MQKENGFVFHFLALLQWAVLSACSGFGSYQNVPLASFCQKVHFTLFSLALKTSQSFIQLGKRTYFSPIGHLSLSNIFGVFQVTLPCLMLIVFAIQNLMLLKKSLLNGLSSYMIFLQTKFTTVHC